MLTKRQVLWALTLSVLAFLLLTAYGLVGYNPKIDSIINNIFEISILVFIFIIFYMTLICVFSFVLSATFRQSRTVRDQYVQEPVIKLMVWREVLGVGPDETRGDA